MRKFEKPYIQELNPKFDSFRHNGKSYSESIREHSEFCKSLKVTPPNEEEAQRKAAEEYTKERWAGRSGRDERP